MCNCELDVRPYKDTLHYHCITMNQVWGRPWTLCTILRMGKVLGHTRVFCTKMKYKLHETIVQYNRNDCECDKGTNQNQNQIFLLVIPLMTFIHQDLWYGKLIRSSHQRGKPSHTILCTFNRGNNRIWKSIPIPDCLREEWALVNVSFCSGDLKSQWVMISTAPNCGDKIMCLNADSTL